MKIPGSPPSKMSGIRTPQNSTFAKTGRKVEENWIKSSTFPLLTPKTGKVEDFYPVFFHFSSSFKKSGNLGGFGFAQKLATTPHKLSALDPPSISKWDHPKHVVYAHEAPNHSSHNLSMHLPLIVPISLSIFFTCLCLSLSLFLCFHLSLSFLI